jgi:stearoyl-CoA desaturase (delta-9 desaturase)
MSSLYRIVPDEATDACDGRVVYSPLKSAWITAMYAGAIAGGYYYHTAGDLLLFLFSCALTLCFGHSLGMHRKLIHASFGCPLWLEYTMVYLGVLVGLAGPLGMTRTHDMRDWAQRQKACHDYFAHRQSFFKDAFWQMHCDIALAHPPRVRFEDAIGRSHFYRALERTWMWQQLPLALLLYLMGGMGFVVWGVCARVAVCVTGHWLIGYFAHRRGERHWHVSGAGVQGYNIRFCGLITMGECWHNNHHAFPGSAKIGIQPGETDPGWWVLMVMRWLGLAWNIKGPLDLPPRPELQAMA